VGQTTVQGRHITELRDAINALRSHMSLSPYSWQYSATTSDYISANPILEMRTALDQVLGAPSGGHAAGLAQGQPVKAIHIQELRDRVMAAWQSGSGVDIRWMVSDQLGTPRMIFDQSGSLATVSRHDYLPFGEELFAGARTTTLGYTNGDGARQKFTQKERDTETGLDYFGARYHSSMQGRFTSVDPLRASANPRIPQRWNRYSYVANQPTIAIDPDGLSIIIIVVSPNTQTASIRLDSRTGREVRDAPGIARGRGRDRTKENNDTPFGVYRPTANDPHGGNANGTQGGVSGQAARSDNSRFGTGIIYMTSVSGEVLDNNRTKIYIHGGPDLDDHQALSFTNGCVRTENANINGLISDVNNLARNGDPLTNIFIGDDATLNAIAGERDQNGNYKYPELRTAFGMSDANPNGGGETSQEDEDQAANEPKQADE